MSAVKFKKCLISTKVLSVLGRYSLGEVPMIRSLKVVILFSFLIPTNPAQATDARVAQAQEKTVACTEASTSLPTENINTSTASEAAQAAQASGNLSQLSDSTALTEQVDAFESANKTAICSHLGSISKVISNGAPCTNLCATALTDVEVKIAQIEAEQPGLWTQCQAIPPSAAACNMFSSNQAALTQLQGFQSSIQSSQSTCTAETERSATTLLAGVRDNLDVGGQLNQVQQSIQTSVNGAAAGQSDLGGMCGSQINALLNNETFKTIGNGALLVGLMGMMNGSFSGSSSGSTGGGLTGTDSDYQSGLSDSDGDGTPDSVESLPEEQQICLTADAYGKDDCQDYFLARCLPGIQEYELEDVYGSTVSDLELEIHELNQTNCASFVSSYCGSGSDSGVGTGSSFCTSWEVFEYCKVSSNASSPTCQQVASNNSSMCQSNPSACLDTLSPEEFAAQCEEFPLDPACIRGDAAFRVSSLPDSLVDPLSLAGGDSSDSSTASTSSSSSGDSGSYAVGSSGNTDNNSKATATTDQSYNVVKGEYASSGGGYSGAAKAYRASLKSSSTDYSKYLKQLHGNRKTASSSVASASSPADIDSNAYSASIFDRNTEAIRDECKSGTLLNCYKRAGAE